MHDKVAPGHRVRERIFVGQIAGHGHSAEFGEDRGGLFGAGECPDLKSVGEHAGMRVRPMNPEPPVTKTLLVVFMTGAPRPRIAR